MKHVILLFIAFILHINSYAQSFADKLKTDWSIEIVDHMPDTLILYHNLQLVRVQKYYRTWLYINGNIYLQGDLDNRMVAMNSITELKRVRWEIFEKDGITRLRMKHELHVVTYTAIPIWKNDSLEKVKLIHIRSRKRVFWCYFPVWYKKGRSMVRHFIWRYF